MQTQFPKEQTDLLQAVYDMRQAQKAYFNQRDDYRLRVSKVKESNVDNMLLPYIKAGAIKVPLPTTPTEPPKLF